MARNSLLDSASHAILKNSTDLAIETISLKALKRNTRNVRRHSKKQIREIASAIKRFGFTNPIIVDDNNIVLAGGLPTLLGSVEPIAGECDFKQRHPQRRAMRRRLRSGTDARCRRDQMATDVESVVDRSMCREEPLSRSR